MDSAGGESDTIAAPVTAPGRAPVSIIRVSGTGSRSLLERVARQAQRIMRNPRKLLISEIRIPCPAAQHSGCAQWREDEPSLDHALIAFFPAPHSYTGEDCVEFHLHGSPYVVSRFLDALQSCAVRMARPGEFTERAFLNGQVDLTQAEAIADLINADTELQAQGARRQLGGELAAAVTELGGPLQMLLAQIEAYLDFPEEGLEFSSAQNWLQEIEAARVKMARWRETFSVGRLCREGANVVLTGVPNAGKSSLLNAMCGESRAIVTPIPGTTRDSIEVHLNLSGLYVRLWDTAGIVDDSPAKPSDPIEKLGIERSWERIRQADLVLFVFDLSAERTAQESLWRKVAPETSSIQAVVNKVDLADGRLSLEDCARWIDYLTGEAPVVVSALQQSNLEGLAQSIRGRLLGKSPAMSSGVIISNRRHFEALERALLGLDATAKAIETRTPAEFVALELRATLGSLSDIIGVTTSEDILERIFSTFCIGK